MSLAEVLVGGGLTLAGSFAAQLYAARRERQRDEAAAAAARLQRRRAALTELHVALEQILVQDVLIRRGSGNTELYGIAMGRAVRAMSLTPDEDLRMRTARALDLVRRPEAIDPESPDHPSGLVYAIGERIRDLSEP